ncbi:glycosyl transferase gt-a type structural fold protein [Fusarium flagelliforme]|uniref:Glycosyl transferase gt-a type structural fold protein n=1 Tax=Fusarium flagelliforme TaxID=2675880 RepID=A0A395MGI1_9HYPO|nr:glycosyl transferase gt-a type structural fold protein [Fusarium flagelliforme]
MTVFTWFAQRAGGLSMISLSVLCYWVISRDSTLEQQRYSYDQTDSKGVLYPSASNIGAGSWSYVFAYYCLLVHVLVCIFPLRACWTIWNLTQYMKRAARSDSLLDLKRLASRRDSYASASSSETLISTRTSTSSSTTSEAGDCDPDFYTDGVPGANDNVVHAIIIPNYKEEIDTLRETLDVLASHPQAHYSYDVYLGMEQRESTAETKALGLIQEFAKRFRSLDFTLHPSDIPGEAAGKGSNIGWAARKLSEKYPSTLRNSVIVTADSHLSSNYFTILTNMHLSYSETALTTVYSAPIIFDRNAHSVPAVVRVADILWGAAGMSGLYPGSSIAPPTSVYSLPLDLIDRVGGWDCGSEAIGEDLHMYIKCFFALNGNLTSRVIYSPISQSNVTGGGGLLKDARARYKQALRHMWGALDTGFALCRLVQLWKDRKQTHCTYQPLHYTLSAANDVAIPETFIIDEQSGQPHVENGIFSGIHKDTVEQPHWERIFYMMHRLFEAHFLPVHMAILVISSALYVKLTENNDDPRNLTWIFDWCNIIRIYGFFQIGIYVSLYESYHQVGVATREREMVKAGLADGTDFSRRSLKKNWYDYLVIPVVAPLYGTIPSAQALICQLWGQDLVYTVSKKATRQQIPIVKVDDMA